jgi:hypothetical protein
MCKEDCNKYIVVDGDTLVKRGCKSCCEVYYLGLKESMKIAGVNNSTVKLCFLGVDGVPESDIETIIEYANAHTLSGVVSALAKYLSDKDAEGLKLLAMKYRKGM